MDQSIVQNITGKAASGAVELISNGGKATAEPAFPLFLAVERQTLEQKTADVAEPQSELAARNQEAGVNQARNPNAGKATQVAHQTIRELMIRKPAHDPQQDAETVGRIADPLIPFDLFCKQGDPDVPEQMAETQADQPENASLRIPPRSSVTDQFLAESEIVSAQIPAVGVASGNSHEAEVPQIQLERQIPASGKNVIPSRRSPAQVVNASFAEAEPAAQEVQESFTQEQISISAG